MRITFFSAKPYDISFFKEHNKENQELIFHEVPLDIHSVQLANNSTAVCVFVNDKVDAVVMEMLSKIGIKYIALRCAGFNNIDLVAAKTLGIKVCRVPAYSPEAVAEHAVALLLTLNRKTHKAYNRVREQNFSLNGLLGFDLYGKTVGVVGTGNIGAAFAKIMIGFGCKVLAFDVVANKQLETLGVEYVPLIELFNQADIVSLHCPLNNQTKHIIQKDTLQMMKNGVFIINTSRGGLVNTKDVIDGLKQQKIGALALDVYEQEEHLFFNDLSDVIIEDDEIQRLMSFPNVLITAHQAFFTNEALTEIALKTFDNLNQLAVSGNISDKAALLA